MIHFVPILISYLLGSIPFGLLVSRFAGIDDIRKYGSGNIGATNVGRVAGFKVAIWVYLGDIAKGIVAVMVARYYISSFGPLPLSNETFLVLTAIAAVLGHVFPVFLRFRGGKGVNTAMGVMVAIVPVEALLAFTVFLVLVFLTRYVSLSSMVAVVVFPLILICEKYFMKMDIADVYMLIGVIIAVLVVTAHRKNIGRLLKGTESQIKRPGNSKGECTHV